MLYRKRFRAGGLSVILVACTLVPAFSHAATITDVTITYGGTAIARAPSGEIAPPPAAPLTINDVRWSSSITPKQVLTYLEKTVRVSATAVGRPWGGNYKIIGIRGDNKTVKLEPAR